MCTKKLSIIIPVYNVEKYLKECLNSICKQWTEEVEIILVNDGSTDCSGNICDYYASKYDFISVIHQANKGLGGARNTGTTAANGQYISWIDSDDMVTDEWICSVLSVINRYKPDVIIYDFMLFGNIKEKKIKYGRKPGFIEKDVFLEDVVRDTRMKAYAWQKVIKRELCKNELFSEDKLPLEDFEIMYRLLKNADTAYYIDKILYRYRQRDNSLIKGHTFQQTLHSYELADNRLKQVDKKFYGAACTAKAIQAFRLYNYEVKNVYNIEVEKCIEARRYIKNNIIHLLKDTELSIKWKVAFLVAAADMKFIIKRITK